MLSGSAFAILLIFYSLHQPLRISEEGKKTQHRSSKLEKVNIAQNYIWALLHGGRNKSHIDVQI